MSKIKEHITKVSEYHKETKTLLKDASALYKLSIVNAIFNIIMLVILFDPVYETLLLFNRWLRSFGHLIIEPDLLKVGLVVIGLIIWSNTHIFIIRLMYADITGTNYSQLKVLKMYVFKTLYLVPIIVVTIALGFISQIFYVLPLLALSVLSYYQMTALKLGSFRKAFKSQSIIPIQFFIFGEFVNIMTFGLYGIRLKTYKCIYQGLISKKESR